MPIPVACGGCGKRFKAPDRGAGKQVPCPACKTMISIPAAEPAEAEDDEYRLAEPPPAVSVIRALPPKVMSPSPSSSGALSPTTKAWVPSTRSSTPSWLRHLHWCLALAMIPLAVSIFVPDKSVSESIAQTSDEPATAEPSPSQRGKAATPAAGQPVANTEPTPDEEARLSEAMEQMSVDELFAALPGHKLPGALLARNSYLHWLFAFIAAAAYMTFLVFLASDKSAQPLHLLGLGLFTATGGIILLLVVQALAGLGFLRVRGGIIGLILLILGLIGLSYNAALSPDTGFVLSFVGFTCGVGLCEEVCKAIPILVYYRTDNQQTWRGAFLWGLASGTGFGVSEGVMYSQDFYNGISGPGIYVVRFVSCVALHAIWSGSVGISVNQRQYLLQEDHEDWWIYALAVLQMIAIPMVLHGLYDTLLKKDMEFFALVTAGASFGYLAWQISHLRTSDDEDERAAYVSQYIRSKAVAQGA
ncbi:MAG TPA: PrsW family glutamic-type intramembrane protease [Pirellulaceae bacterium]|nr:PrsW family glutamic-type intramembrane protease [Pirellulaceae bacterium]